MQAHHSRDPANAVNVLQKLNDEQAAALYAAAADVLYMSCASWTLLQLWILKMLHLLQQTE